MTQTTVSYKVQLAMDFIVNGIAEGRFPPGSALPPIRKLAPMAGVSYVTLWKAVGALQEQGVLSAIPGQLTMVRDTSPGSSAPAAGTPPPPSAGMPLRSAVRIKERIERDISEGVYEPGSKLPLLKQLRSRYGAAYRTVSEALRILCREGVIRMHGRRGYQVPLLSTLDSKAAICFLVDKRYVEHYIAGMIEGHDYLHPIELQSAKQSLKIILGECSYDGDQLVPDNKPVVFPHAKKTGRAILGYVFRMNEPDGNVRLFNQLKDYGKPVSILDERGSWDLAEIPGGSPLFKVFPVATNQLPGMAVGRYLLGLGHRKIAYISPYQQVPWSQVRLAGLREAFRRAGHKDGVVECLVDSTTMMHRGVGKHDRPPDAPGDSETIDLSGRLSARERDRRTFLEDAQKISDRFRGHVVSLFTQALRDTSITAWVVANDGVAVRACDFLREHRVKVPRRISLVSFDDSHGAIAYKITSYNFNIHSIVNAALRHILDYPSRRKQTGPVCEEIEGVIVERETSGPAPTRP